MSGYTFRQVMSKLLQCFRVYWYSFSRINSPIFTWLVSQSRSQGTFTCSRCSKETKAFFIDRTMSTAASICCRWKWISFNDVFALCFEVSRHSFRGKRLQTTPALELTESLTDSDYWIKRFTQNNRLSRVIQCSLTNKQILGARHDCWKKRKMWLIQTSIL